MRRVNTISPDGTSAVRAVYKTVIADEDAGMQFIGTRRFAENHDVARH